MYSNYNYYPQQTQQSKPQLYQNPQLNPIYQQNYLRQAPSQVNLKGRLVSSLEEARATSIDFDGSIFYFPDLANKRIYTKQINMDGTATLCMYELKELPIEKENGGFVPSVEKFVTREEFERVLEQLRQMLQKPTEPAAESAPLKTEKVELLSF